MKTERKKKQWNVDEIFSSSQLNRSCPRRCITIYIFPLFCSINWINIFHVHTIVHISLTLTQIDMQVASSLSFLEMNSVREVHIPDIALRISKNHEDGFFFQVWINSRAERAFESWKQTNLQEINYRYIGRIT